MKNHSELEHVGSILLRVLDSIPNLATLGRLSAGISVNMPRHATNDSQAIPSTSQMRKSLVGHPAGLRGKRRRLIDANPPTTPPRRQARDTTTGQAPGVEAERREAGIGVRAGIQRTVAQRKSGVPRTPSVVCGL